MLGALGNGARGLVVVLIGIFTIVAAFEEDASETTGLDGSLKRVLDESYGKALVVFVVIGLAAFAAYSIPARAGAHRRRSRVCVISTAVCTEGRVSRSVRPNPAGSRPRLRRVAPWLPRPSLRP